MSRPIIGLLAQIPRCSRMEAGSDRDGIMGWIRNTQEDRWPASQPPQSCPSLVPPDRSSKVNSLAIGCRSRGAWPANPGHHEARSAPTCSLSSSLP